MAMRGRLSLLALLLAMVSPSATAQDGEWPMRTVRLIVPSGPGGNPDGAMYGERILPIIFVARGASFQNTLLTPKRADLSMQVSKNE
jgi:hypothetical protein